MYSALAFIVIFVSGTASSKSQNWCADLQVCCESTVRHCRNPFNLRLDRIRDVLTGASTIIKKVAEYFMKGILSKIVSVPKDLAGKCVKMGRIVVKKITICKRQLKEYLDDSVVGTVANSACSDIDYVLRRLKKILKWLSKQKDLHNPPKLSWFTYVHSLTQLWYKPCSGTWPCQKIIIPPPATTCQNAAFCPTTLVKGRSTKPVVLMARRLENSLADQVAAALETHEA